MSLRFKQTSSELRNEWPNGPPRDSVFNVSASASRRSWLSNSLASLAFGSWSRACRDRSHSAACNSEALWHTPRPPQSNTYCQLILYLSDLSACCCGWACGSCRSCGCCDACSSCGCFVRDMIWFWLLRCQKQIITAVDICMHFTPFCFPSRIQ